MDGLYTGLSGAMVLEQRLDIVAHDLANLNTPGHKRTQLVADSEYPVILASLIHMSDPVEFSTTDPSGVPYGDQILASVAETRIDFSQGMLRQTGSPTDLAIDGPGFFVVNVDGEQMYSRAGAFELDADGQLVARVGDRLIPVQGDGGPIVPGSMDFSVSRDGSVLDAQGNPLGTMRLVDFADPQRLERAGFTLFRDASGEAGLREVPPAERTIRQGMIEMSNADPVSSLVAMIEIQRAHQAVSKAMQTADETTSRRISEVMQ
jgi:flagellar basal-body rod protein FlgF